MCSSIIRHVEFQVVNERRKETNEEEGEQSISMVRCYHTVYYILAFLAPVKGLLNGLINSFLVTEFTSQCNCNIVIKCIQRKNRKHQGGNLLIMANRLYYTLHTTVSLTNSHKQTTIVQKR